MKKSINITSMTAAALVCFGIGLLAPQTARAHCDTMDGPVVTTAMKALEKSDITPVLKWVKKEQEAEIRDAFKQTLSVRAQGAQAKTLADRYFFETLVRLHRASEGVPYEGLKPAGAQIEPAVKDADNALEKGKVENLAKEVADAVAEGIRSRFARATEAKKHADESVEKGREFVEAYVEYVHYVERLHEAAVGQGAHHAAAKVEANEGRHQH